MAINRRIKDVCIIIVTIQWTASQCVVADAVKILLRSKLSYLCDWQGRNSVAPLCLTSNAYQRIHLLWLSSFHIYWIKMEFLILVLGTKWLLKSYIWYDIAYHYHKCMHTSKPLTCFFMPLISLLMTQDKYFWDAQNYLFYIKVYFRTWVFSTQGYCQWNCP